MRHTAVAVAAAPDLAYAQLRRQADSPPARPRAPTHCSRQHSLPDVPAPNHSVTAPPGLQVRSPHYYLAHVSSHPPVVAASRNSIAQSQLLYLSLFPNLTPSPTPPQTQRIENLSILQSLSGKRYQHTPIPLSPSVPPCTCPSPGVPYGCSTPACGVAWGVGPVGAGCVGVSHCDAPVASCTK